MADPFTPKFVDLVRNTTTTAGTGNFVLGPAVNGFTSFTVGCQVGDSFYYSAIGIDKPAEREVGRGILLAGGIISRDPIGGVLTNFSNGTKVLALITASEWFSRIEAETGASVESRAALASSSTARGAALLCEAGREGLFVWDGSNRSASVSADPSEGILVAPSNDRSGASGAWVRKDSGPISVKWFGAKGDGATDDGAAFAAVLAYLKTHAVNDETIYRGSPRLLIPAGTYNLGATTLDITHTLIIEGEGSGLGGGKSTKLIWSGATGIRIQDYETTGDTGTNAAHYAGTGTVIRGLALQGGYTNTEAEFHGIQMRTFATVEDVIIDRFEGDGIHIVANVPTSNANTWQINRVRVQFCRNGFYCDNADVNAGTSVGLSCGSNRQWGIWDSSFLGNNHIGVQVDSNGYLGTGSFTPSVVSYNGFWYTPVAGQEAAASTNAPSGTNTDNAYWVLVAPGGPGTNVPLWSSGITVRSGGSVLFDSVSNGGLLTGYIEGSQGPAQLYGSSVSFGGSLGFVRGAQWLGGGGAGPLCYGDMRVQGRHDQAIQTSLGSSELGAACYEGILKHSNAGQIGVGNTFVFGWWPGGANSGILHWTNYRTYYGADYCPFQISTDVANGADAPWGHNRMNFPQGYGLAGKKVYSGTAAPTSGGYNVGDQVINSAPAAGGKIGWVCVTAGTPGTWKPFGTIDA